MVDKFEKSILIQYNCSKFTTKQSPLGKISNLSGLMNVKQVLST